MLDFVNDQVPPNISDLFSYSSEKHQHYTRSSAAGNLCLKYSRTNIKKIFLKTGCKDLEYYSHLSSFST